MSDSQFPIDPARDSAGRIRALIPYLGEKASVPVPVPTLGNQWDVETDSRTSSTSAYAKLGVSSIVSTEATLNHRTAVWDALVGRNAVAEDTTADTVIFETFWGIGLRIAITYRDTQIKGETNVASIAATAEYQRVDVQYEIKSVGLGPSELADVLSAIPPLGQFDMNAYNQLNSVRGKLVASLQKKLADIDEAATILQPAIVSLARVPFADELAEAAEYRFAMQSIASGLTREQALARLTGDTWKNVRPARVKRIYKQVLGDDDKPSAKAKKDARDWLSLTS